MKRSKRATETLESPRLSTFIRAHQREIVVAWERAVRQLPVARELDRPALVDFVPKLLERIADMADELAAGKRPHLPVELAEVHALERLDEGFDLEQVVTEYAVLRDCIVRLCAAEFAIDMTDAAGILALNQAIDRAVAASVQRFTLARDRTLRLIDRISAAALETRSLDDFLHRMLHVLLETTAAADTATIMLRDRDVLRTRASVGLEAEVEAGWSLPVGTGFSGLIAKTGRSHAVQSAATDPLVLSPSLKAKGVKALLGVPLIERGEVIGVAHMGSLTAKEFSKQDRRMFEAMAHRATSAIRLHVLREQADRHIVERQQAQAALEEALRQQHAARADAERSLAVLDTILAASSVGIGFIDRELRFVRVNDALAAIDGVPAAQHIGRTVHEVVPELAATMIEPSLHRVIETREPIENVEVVIASPSVPNEVHSYIANYVPVLTVQGDLVGVGAVIVDVTERKRMELDLRERELQFRSIADNIPQLAWMADETGGGIWFNRRWYEFTGMTLEQMRGTGWQALHDPTYIASVVTRFNAHIATGEPWEDTFPMRGADGRFHWFLSRAVPIKDERGRVVRWFGTNTDISEQRFMNEAMKLLSSSLDYRETLQQVARLALPALGDWCLVDVTEGSELTRLAVAHIDPAKVELGHELARCYPPDPNATTGVPNVLRTGRTEYVPEISDEMLVTRISDPDHLRLARELGLKSYVMAPLIARDRTLGVITFVSAESARRFTPAQISLIEELGRRAGLAIDNARLLEDAQREARMREEILAVVSHDLKNPLGAVHLAATMLLQQAEPPARRHLETIERATTRMDHLIGDLLDMASIQAGRLAIERRAEDVNAIIREVLEINEPMAMEKQIALIAAHDLPDTRVCADRERLIQVFGNLIGNSLKFGHSGDTITIRGKRVGTAAELAVSDTGPGISAEELPHIFEPYWSAKKYTKKGTGLGLYISKGIVEAHGGHIWVESTLGAGTTFYFTIPLA